MNENPDPSKESESVEGSSGADESSPDDNSQIGDDAESANDSAVSNEDAEAGDDSGSADDSANPEVAPASVGDTEPVDNPSGMEVYDFTHPQHRLREPLTQLTITGKKIAEEMTAAFDTVLHVAGIVDLESVEYRKRQEYVDKLDDGISVFKSALEPLSVDALILIDRELILSMVERFFGGSESAQSSSVRGLSKTEQRLANRLRSCITGAMQSVYGRCFKVDRETDLILSAEDLTSASSEQSVIATLKFSLKFDTKVTNFIILLPWAAVESIHNSFNNDKLYNAIENPQWISRLSDHLEACYIDLQGQLAESEVTVEQLVNMQSGDFIPLGDLGTATFMIDNTPVFEAAIGASEGQVSASILRWINHRES